MPKNSFAHSKLYELGFTLLLIVNAILLIYFIFRINQLESISQETQAQTNDLIIKLQEQSL